MKVALDTTYFMYGFDLSPKIGIPQDVLDVFNENDEVSEIIFSDLVIFELNAKASKSLSDCIDLDNRTELLVKLEKNSKFKLVLSSKFNLWEIACFLRKYHKDYVDCVHWATAINEQTDFFITEDEVIEKLSKKTEFKNDFTAKFKKSLPIVTDYKGWIKINTKKI